MHWARVANALEQLALTTPSTFNTILGSVGGANDQQKIAIATALSQAAKTMVLTDEALAADWQQKILAITDPAFKTAAVNAFGDVKLGAVGGAPGSGPLGGPNGAPGGVGALQVIGSTPIPTGAFAFMATSMACSRNCGGFTPQQGTLRPIAMSW